jgi:hypothetical protein
MSDQNQNVNDEEKPEIYSVNKGENDFSFARRDFLVTAAVGTAAVAMLSAGIHTLSSDSSPEQNSVADGKQMISLEVDALGLIVAPVASTINRTWRIFNRGKQICPKSILHFSAQHDPDVLHAVEVSEIVPGQFVDVPVSLMAPDAPGKYRYQWQLKVGSVAGVSRENEFYVVASGAVLAESNHPYQSFMDQTWTINNPDTSAISTYVHFSRLEVEQDFDYVYVKDGSGNIIQTLTGSYPAGLWSNAVNGQVVQVQLTSDSAVEEWGFQVDEVRSSFYMVYLPLIHRPEPTPTSYVVCSCNTVETCTCNLVCVCEAVCSCDGYCSCNTVCSCVGHCSCNRVCTCDTVHYWYPN